MKYRDLLKMVQSVGWRLIQTNGSHQQYKYPTKAGRVTLAGKPGKDVPMGTLKNVLRQAGLK